MKCFISVNNGKTLDFRQNFQKVLLIHGKQSQDSSAILNKESTFANKVNKVDLLNKDSIKVQLFLQNRFIGTCYC